MVLIFLNLLQLQKEAVQWLYFAYLAAIKDQNGAAMSLGRTSTFLDIYFERDLQNGTLTEKGGSRNYGSFYNEIETC